MDNKYGWYALNHWATALERKYPRKNLLSVSDRELAKMLLSLDEAKGMPSLPDEKAYFSALVSAWIEVQYGRDDSKAIPDAYI